MQAEFRDDTETLFIVIDPNTVVLNVFQATLLAEALDKRALLQKSEPNPEQTLKEIQERILHHHV